MTTMTAETIQMRITVNVILAPLAATEWSKSQNWHGQQDMGLYSAWALADEDEWKWSPPLLLCWSARWFEPVQRVAYGSVFCLNYIWAWKTLSAESAAQDNLDKLPVFSRCLWNRLDYQDNRWLLLSSIGEETPWSSTSGRWKQD